MVKDDEVHFIDYQGGMQGALQYDVASMLWQARAALPNDWKDELAGFYFDEVNRLLKGTLNRKDFMDSKMFFMKMPGKFYKGIVLLYIIGIIGNNERTATGSRPEILAVAACLL